MTSWTATLNIDFERTLARVIEALYPHPNRRAGAVATLEAFAQGLPQKERPRVLLAVLKLAGDDADQLRYYASNADYRDILMWAEYPDTSESDRLWKTDPQQYARLRRKEQDAYLDWIRSLGVEPLPPREIRPSS